MNIKEHLLTCLAEEANEVAQDCCKALRFGIDDVNVTNPAQGSNRDRLVVELNQLLEVCEQLVQIGILPPSWQHGPQAARIRLDKQKKLIQFVEYAQQVGALQSEEARQ